MYPWYCPSLVSSVVQRAAIGILVPTFTPGEDQHLVNFLILCGLCLAVDLMIFLSHLSLRHGIDYATLSNIYFYFSLTDVVN